jgi:hypothetical protein
MLIWPHCGQQRAIPCAGEFAFIDVGRFTCERCGKEFLVLDNVPMIEQLAQIVPADSASNCRLD